MEIATKCPICETLGNAIPVYPSNVDDTSFSTEVFSARRLPDRRHYQWVRCNSCTLLRSDPVLDVDLEKLYVESTFDYSTEIDGLKRTYFDLVMKALSGKKLKKSIFEVGGGNGFFLEAAKDGGFLSVALIRQVAPTWLSPASCSMKSRLSSSRKLDAITWISHRRKKVYADDSLRLSTIVTHGA